MGETDFAAHESEWEREFNAVSSHIKVKHVQDSAEDQFSKLYYYLKAYFLFIICARDPCQDLYPVFNICLSI